MYEEIDKECTGIVTTVFASYDVIKQASELGANLVITHESCFWNHGDQIDWLSENETFKLKKKLLDDTGVTVWRDHDYIHSGVLHDNEYVDGIFYGLAQELGWGKYIIDCQNGMPQFYQIPKQPTRVVAQYLMEKMGLKGLKTMGDLEGYTEKIYVPLHIFGQQDNQIISTIEEKNIDTILTMEMIDFTVATYMRDSAQASLNKRVFAAGHFNVEEPGMKWFGEKHLPQLLLDIKVKFIQSGDAYNMLLRKYDD